MIWASKQVGAPKTGELLDRLCLAATRAAPPISRRISSAGARAVVVEAVGGNGGEGGGGGGGGVRGDVVRVVHVEGRARVLAEGVHGGRGAVTKDSRGSERTPHDLHNQLTMTAKSGAFL